MKFRVEMNIGCLETITTNEKSTQGLKANKSFFVELEAYRAEYGEPEPPSSHHRLPSLWYQSVWSERESWQIRMVEEDWQTYESSETGSTVGRGISSWPHRKKALDNIQSAAKRAVLRDIRPIRHEDAPMAGVSSSSSGATCLKFNLSWMNSK